MDKKTIEDKLRVIIVDCIGVEPEKVKTDTNIIDDLYCDSLDVVEIVMHAEQEFGIQVEDPYVDQFRTFSGAVEYIASKLN